MFSKEASIIIYSFFLARPTLVLHRAYTREGGQMSLKLLQKASIKAEDNIPTSKPINSSKATIHSSTEGRCFQGSFIASEAIMIPRTRILSIVPRHWAQNLSL